MADDPQLQRFYRLKDSVDEYSDQRKDITTAVEIQYDERFWKNLPTYQISARNVNNLKNNSQLLIKLILARSDTAIIQQYIVDLGSHLTTPEGNADVLSMEEITEATTVSDVMLTSPNVENPVLAERANALFAPFLTDPIKNGAVFWGPAVAVILMRLERRTPETTLQKLKNLAENLTRLYPGKAIACPKFDNDLWIEFLKPLHNIAYNDPAKNTVYIGMIEAYNRVGVSNNTMGLLDFIMLQALRYTGMIVITLAAQIREALHCPEQALIFYTMASASLPSWERYARLLESYLRRPETINDNEQDAEGKRAKATDTRWMYSREFRSGVFQELSYPKNSYLCNMLAAILDYTSSENYTAQLRGPVVRGLTELRNVQLSEADYDIAFVTYQALREQYMTKPIGGLAEDMRVRAFARRRARDQIQQAGAEPDVQRLLERELFDDNN